MKTVEEIAERLYPNDGDDMRSQELRAAFIAGANIDQWVKIIEGDENTLPEDNEGVFIWIAEKGLGIARFDTELKVFAIKTQPTHWQPLTTPPTA